MAKQGKGINPDLEAAISQLLKSVMSDPMASLTDKAKVLDRALKLEMVKLKLQNDEWGAAFNSGEDDDDDEQCYTMIAFLLSRGDKYGRITNGKIGTERYHGKVVDDIIVDRSIRNSDVFSNGTRLNQTRNSDSICSLCLRPSQKQGA